MTGMQGHVILANCDGHLNKASILLSNAQDITRRATMNGHSIIVMEGNELRTWINNVGIHQINLLIVKVNTMTQEWNNKFIIIEKNQKQGYDVKARIESNVDSASYATMACSKFPFVEISNCIFQSKLGRDNLSTR